MNMRICANMLDGLPVFAAILHPHFLQIFLGRRIRFFLLFFLYCIFKLFFQLG